ncbi:uncharacterized protein LOC113395049 [Vanessa tameamea]|uniref:Transmembrane protein 186 n=1 Tax=Vanessa tameamea TaxID=334116 RepID=A0A8B8HXC9_VANTA|nr:uncharacterized protein LOC113395049 [Vanessa tameamea]
MFGRLNFRSTRDFTMSLTRLPCLFRKFSSTVKNESEPIKFDPVFSFPFVKYIALISRLKVYHLYGSCIVIPSSGLMELLNFASENTFFIASYIGITGGAVLSLCTLPFKNVIGQLYLSEDNKFVKISSVGFSGKRIDRIVDVNDWIPILDLKPRTMDAIYLRPELTDGTKYKLFVKFGIVRDSKRIGQILE